jgi:hydroxymethylglutaryl-CoA reductase
MCICPHRDPECTSKTKVRQLEVISLVDKEILWFEVAVQDAMGMTVEKTGI